jgi:hypothetical protein
VLQQLASLVAPFHRMGQFDPVRARQQALQQAHESERLLKQLRAELRLMRAWKRAHHEDAGER